MKKLLVATVMLGLLGCSKSAGKAEALAQSRLKALSPEGITYQKNLSAQTAAQSATLSSSDQTEIADMAYRDFVETCMQGKGFDLIPMYLKNNPGNSPAGCWIDDGKAMLPKSNADNPDCYEPQ